MRYSTSSKIVSSNRDTLIRIALIMCDSPFALALNLSQAAVYKQFNTGDKAAVIRRQEQCCLGNFVWMAHAPQRYAGRQICLELSQLFLRESQAVQNWRINWAGADCVDTNLSRFEVSSPRSGKGTNRSL